MLPFEINPVVGEKSKELIKYFKGKKSGFVQVGPEKRLFPVKYAEHAENYYNFDLNEDDVWIMTFPKSGTTLTQELVWMINNNLDYEASSKMQLFDRCPFLEFHVVWDDKFLKDVAELNGNEPKVLEEIKNVDTPVYETALSMKRRHFKTHLPPSLLPPALIETCKVIYVARNPFDVAASYYHHCKLMKAYDFHGDFKDFWNLFEKDLVVTAPYWDHIKEGWSNRNHPNFLFLFYEDLIRDFPGNIRKVAKFLNKQMTEDEVNKLADHLHIDNFRKNVKVTSIMNVKGIINTQAQNFFRRGKVGGNKEFDDELKIKAEKWFKENLAKTDIKFPEF
uniref:Putative sulfotransferase 1c4-like protein n=1 Tax=Rhodnius prolixus TaxID=13249 RepID=A0A4P6D7N0_RHOPR